MGTGEAKLLIHLLKSLFFVENFKNMIWSKSVEEKQTNITLAHTYL